MNTQKTSRIHFLLPVSLMLLQGILGYGQQSATKDCNACAYLPLCNPDEVKRFAGKEYAGFNDEDGNVIWYNCDGGVVTMKWLSSFTPVDYYITQNSITNTKTETYTTGPTQYTMNTSVILKYNLPVGGSWSDGNRIWTIMKKGASYTFDGVNYPDVICVHYKEKGTNSLAQSHFYYYAKGKGLVKRIKGDTFDDTFMKMVEKEKEFVKDGKLTGTIDKFFVGKWSRTSSDGGTIYYVEFFENGTGVNYNEPKRIVFGGGNMNDMSGRFITNNSQQFFFWRVDNDLVFTNVSSNMNVGKVNRYKITKNEYAKSFSIDGVNAPYVFLYTLELPGSMADHMPVIVERKPLATPFKGKIDNKFVGVWVGTIDQQSVVWSFDADGTFQFKCDQLPQAVKDKYALKEISGEWRVNGGSMEILFAGAGEIKMHALQEKLVDGVKSITLPAGNTTVVFQKFAGF